MDIQTYIAQNRERFYEELFSLIRIPSISAHSERRDDMQRCATRWAELLLEAGVDRAEVLPTKGNPVVYAEKRVGDALPTILVYGHYDVMPVEPLELWASDPFEPTIRDGRIYARGANDDKGQSFMHAKAFEYLMKTNNLPVNVKFLIEGEEEIGSPNLEDFCREHRDLLACDTILVSDTGMFAEDVPSITTGLRGLAYWQIEVTAAARDLHSGLFGGAVANPLIELSKIIARLVDADGHITIPHFYDDVDTVSPEERELMAQIPFDETAYKQSVGIRELHGETGYSTVERTGIRPSLDVCGMWGGYTGEGSKTVLPAKAYAKLSARLVPHQQPDKIATLVADHIRAIAPNYVDVQVEWMHGAEPYVCPIDLPVYKAAEQAYQQVYGKRPLPVRSGGSIGVVPVFERVLGVKSILMGFGLESDAIHSPNESFMTSQFEKGIRTIVAFYEAL